MNAHTHLLSQGWLGPGHALQPSQPNGLKHHLLVSQKLDNHGIGKKKHDSHADQWWLRAFDNTLKDINVGVQCSKGVKSKDTKLSVGPRLENLRLGKWFRDGGLYSGFVKGEGMEGTLQEEESTIRKGGGLREGSEVTKRAKKRKRVSSKLSEAQDPLRADAALSPPDSLGIESRQDAVVETVNAPSAESKEARRQRKREKKLKRAQAAEATARMSESGHSIQPRSEVKVRHKKKKSRHREVG